MSLTTIFLITLAALFALGFVFFKYFRGNRKPGSSTWFLAIFRFISIFLILLLLINPAIKQLELEVRKPDLFIAVDQSASMEHLEVNDSVLELKNYLINHPELQERFNLRSYGFGKEITPLEGDTIKFNRQQTDISRALRDLSKLNKRDLSAIILLTDGNQTVGEDYRFWKPGNVAVFPVIAGDTTTRTDLAIANLNVNKYAFLENRFPVEAILNYTGQNPVQTSFRIKLGNSVLFSEDINFDENKNSAVITSTLPASGLGTKIYEAEIVPVEGERNLVNNTTRFGIEIIDERTSVLILTDVPHPDLGMFKKSIEQNKQREATIAYLRDSQSLDLNEYQLIILYQPNNRFKAAFDEIRESGLNYLLVTGMKTNWNFLNSVQSDFSKDFSYQPQEVFPVYNPNYSRFRFENIGFASFPPLLDAFGVLEFQNEASNILLYQRIEGIATQDPLLVTFESGSAKRGVLFGENIWQWRAHSFVENGSFENFDNFFGKLIQFLSATQRRDRLTFEAEPFYPENEEVVITARFYDETYQFNPEGELNIYLQNKTNGENLEAQMLLTNSHYKVSIDNLQAGEYEFEIREEKSGLSRTGSFSIIEYNIEQQFSSANLNKMQTFADNVDTQLYFLNDRETLVSNLIQDGRFTAVQKSREKTLPLISWKFLLFLLILSLSAEWFTRKYFGLI